MQVAIDKTCVKIQESIAIRAVEVSNNGKIIDSLPTAHQSLFQDRAALLELPADELNKEVDKRIAHFEHSQASKPDEPNEPVAQQKKAVDELPYTDEDRKQTYQVIIELMSSKEAAETVKAEIEKVWSGDSLVKNIELLQKTSQRFFITNASSIRNSTTQSGVIPMPLMTFSWDTKLL